MILVTCLVGPWLVDRYGRRLALHEAARPYDASSIPQRILIPIANPSSVASLLDVALLIRDARQKQPLYPITIARDGPNVLEEVAAGERVLAHALLYTASAEVPAMPLTRVEMNVARGLLRAVMESRISTVVMGWNELPAAERFIFGSISDQLLNERRVALLLCRIVEPLHLAERVLLLVPPLAHLELGFGVVLHLVKTLCRQAGTQLVLMAEAEQAPVLYETVRRTKPDVPLTMNDMAVWKDVPTLLDGSLRPHDILILSSARRQAKSWQAGLERLPPSLVQRFGKTSLIIMYPPEESKSGPLEKGRQLPHHKPAASS